MYFGYHDFADAMKYIFEPNCSLHAYHYEDNEVENKAMEKAKGEEWRHQLKVGDLVDAVKGEAKCKSWGLAKIVEVIEEEVKLEFESENPYFDKQIKLWSPDLAPAKTYSPENDWKLELKVGDEVDSFDKSRIWYSSTVVSMKENETITGRKYMNAEVGFRLYHEEGEKMDAANKKYDGYNLRYDEWISANSPKVVKLHTHTKPYGKMRGIKTYEEPINDTNDEPAQTSPVYAVLRGDRCKSSLLIRMANLLGDGYDQMFNMVND